MKVSRRRGALSGGWVTPTTERPVGTQVGGSFIWDQPSLGVSGLPDVGLEASGRAVGGGVSLRPWWAVSTASRRAPLHVLVPGRSRCTCQQVRRSVSGPGFFPVFARTPGPWAHWTLVQKQGGHNLEQKEEVRDRSHVGYGCFGPCPPPRLLLLNYHNLWKGRLSSCRPHPWALSRDGPSSQQKPA